MGKDLSRVALPVQLNEPLNTLQRLCEELEYSALLDRASRARDPRQRLVRAGGHRGHRGDTGDTAGSRGHRGEPGTLGGNQGHRGESGIRGSGGHGGA